MRDYASLYSDLLSDLDWHYGPDRPLSSDMDSLDAARHSLAHSFYKKLCPTGNSGSADLAALEKFLAINERTPETYRFGAENEIESCFWDYFKSNLNAALGPSESHGAFDLESIREGMLPGPGAAQLADSTTFVSKLFEGKMSYTNDWLITLYRAALAETGLWADAEKRRSDRFGFSKVRGGKLFFAPKNADISRTCCTEANLNLLVQKAIGTFIESRLKLHFGISLDAQPAYNRELARIGSKDGTFGTIDLTSASDSICLDMVRQALDNNFLKAVIMASRSEEAVLPDGTSVKLRMISTMGNGFTFPLQTIIFASAVRSCYQLMGYPSACPKTQFCVFGDDIIVRREAYVFVTKMLNKLGFEVNLGKSFNSGPFRESCGHDYFLGHNVRGVYVRSLEIPQHVYSLINRLNRWSAFHGILLPQTLRRLLGWVRDIRIPPSESDDAGIHVPFKATRPRVNSQYWFQYRYYRRKVSRKFYNDVDDAPPPTFNPEGLGVGVLSGYIRRREVSLTTTDQTAWLSKDSWALSATLRDRIGARPRYQIVNSSIPYWDYVGAPDRKVIDSVVSNWSGKSSQIPRTRLDDWRIDLTVDRYGAWESAVLATLPLVE